jgi:tyrosyl-tRNA synthetase
MTLYEELKWRGLIQDITSPDLIEKLNNGGLKFYIGTDPTADSLHLGHYSSFLIVKRLAKAGHIPIILVGVATGLIGDPRGTTERELAVKDEVEHNFEKLKEQVQELFPYEVVNNYDWVKNLNIIDFFRDYGKYINVNYMLSKDLVKRQMETGISYAEFSYMLIQALDFKFLYENKGVELQVAGSDQWGNITTGVELIRKTLGKEVYAFTMPLVTDSKGVKFGKSEGEAVWLNKDKTSAYELYQFLINTDDTMVIEYLKRLTFLSKDEIEEIEREHLEACHLRKAQKVLAKELIVDIHGEEEYNNAVLISKKLFEGNIKELNIKDILAGFKNVPHFSFKEGKIIDILVNCKVCSSKREAREFLGAGAITVNGDVIKEQDFILNEDLAIDKKVVVIRRGKKKYFLGNLEK